MGNRKRIPGLALPETSPKERDLALRVLASEATFDPKTYEFDDSFKKGDTSNFRAVHTIPEIMECLDRNKDVEAGGIFLEADTRGNYRYRRIEGKEKLKETWKANSRLKKFREFDSFAFDRAGANTGLVGDDYVPLLGGPFHKQPYLYDYLRAHAYCFQEYHHHPFATAIVHITRDFVLGRGYRIDSDDLEALAIWRAFEEANNLEQKMEDIVKEGSIYGENLIWWLPNGDTQIQYRVQPGQEPKKGIIPRIRFVDPSTCWEIVTYPEDIERVLFYQIVFPTQYQIYTGRDAGSAVPTSKFIMQQIAAQDMMHFKYNCVSNEKRGRSDLFPVLGYLKWIKDCVNYKLIALKKQAAWTEDISVEGSQQDVDALAASLQSLGTFEPAGSRFLHTSKITRQYMANQHGGSGDDNTLEWGVNMIAAGTQIPATYFGMMHGAGSTRANALVGTEPVAKKFERRQREVQRILQAMWDRVQRDYGNPDAECSITFPEIITQDRTSKLKDIKFVEDCAYISRETAAPLAAKELDIDNYDYGQEKGRIDQESPQPLIPTIVSPLTAPSAVAKATSDIQTKAASGQPTSASPHPDNPGTQSSSAVTSAEKHHLAMRDK